MQPKSLKHPSDPTGKGTREIPALRQCLNQLSHRVPAVASTFLENSLVPALLSSETLRDTDWSSLG